MSDLALAKVFMSGRSQAVRLPKEFRFDTNEVTVQRLPGGGVALRPVHPPGDHAAWVARLTDILNSFEGMPQEIDRDRTPPVDDIESLD